MRKLYLRKSLSVLSVLPFVLECVPFAEAYAACSTSNCSEFYSKAEDFELSGASGGAILFLVRNTYADSGDLPQGMTGVQYPYTGASAALFPTLGRRTLKGSLYYTGSLDFRIAADDKGRLPDIVFNKPSSVFGFFSKNAIYNSGGLRKDDDGVWINKNANTYISAGSLSGYINILNGVLPNVYSGDVSSKGFKGDLYSKGNIYVSGGTFSFEGTSRIGFITASDRVSWDENGSSVSEYFLRGGGGSLYVEGGSFGFSGNGVTATLGTAKNEESDLKNGTFITGGVYNISDGNTLAINGNAIEISSHKNGSFPVFMGDGTLEIGSGANDLINVTTGLTSINNSVKKVVISGIFTLNTNEYFRELEINSGTFSFNKALTVSEKFVLKNATLNAPGGTLSFSGSDVRASFGGSVDLGTLTLKNGARALVTAPSSKIKTVDAEGFSVDGQAALELGAPVDSLQNLNVSGSGRAVDVVSSLNIKALNFVPGSDATVNLVSKRGGTVSSPTIQINGGTVFLNGSRITAWTLTDYGLLAKKDGNYVGGSGALLLTGNGTLNLTGEEFGSELYDINMTAQSGTATVSANESHFGKVNLLYRYQEMGGTGKIIFSGTKATVKALILDQGISKTDYSTLIIGAQPGTGRDLLTTLTVTDSISLAEYSRLYGTGNLIIGENINADGKDFSEIRGDIFLRGNGGGTLTLNNKKNLNMGGDVTVNELHLNADSVLTINGNLKADVVSGKKTSLNVGGNVTVGTASVAANAGATFKGSDNTMSSLSINNSNVTFLGKESVIADKLELKGGNGKLTLGSSDKKEKVTVTVGDIFSDNITNEIKVNENATLAITSSSTELFNDAMKFKLTGGGALWLKDHVNLEINGTSSSDLAEIRCGSGTLKIGGEFSLAKITFNSLNEGNLEVSGKLSLSDNIISGTGNTISAGSGTVVLKNETDSVFGGKTEIGTLQMDKGGTLTFAGSEGKKVSTLTPTAGFENEIVLKEGATLDLENMRQESGTPNVTVTGNGTLHSVKDGGVYMKSLASRPLKNLIIDGTVNVTENSTVQNTVLNDGGELDLSNASFIVPVDGTITLNSGAKIFGSDGHFATIFGTATVTGAIDTGNFLQLSGGVLNYNTDTGRVADIIGVAANASATINVNGNALFKLTQETGSRPSFVIADGKTLRFGDGGLTAGKITGGKGSVLKTNSFEAQNSFIDVEKLDSSGTVTLSGTTTATFDTVEQGSFNLSEQSILTITNALTDQNVSGNGTFVAENGANVTFQTGNAVLGTLNVKSGATATTNARYTNSINAVRNDGILNVTGSLRSEDLVSAGTLSGDVVQVGNTQVGNAVLSGTVSLSELILKDNSAVTFENGVDMHISNLSVAGSSSPSITVNSDVAIDVIADVNAGSALTIADGKTLTAKKIGAGNGYWNVSGNGTLLLKNDTSNVMFGNLNKAVLDDATLATQAHTGYINTVEMVNDSTLNIRNAAGDTFAIGTLNWTAGGTLDIQGQLTVNNDFAIFSEQTLSGVNGSRLVLKGSNNVIDKSDLSAFNGTLVLESSVQNRSVTTFAQNTNLTGFVTNDASVNLGQQTLSIAGSYSNSGSSDFAMQVYGAGYEIPSGQLVLSGASVNGSGSVGLNLNVHYSAVSDDLSSLKLISGKTKEEFTAGNVSLLPGQNNRYKWDATTCDDGTGVCYLISEFKAPEQVAKEHDAKDNQVTVASALFSQTVHPEDGEIYKLMTHLNDLSQKDGGAYVKALSAMTPDLSGTRTYQANGLQNRVISTVGSRMTALMPSLAAPAKVGGFVNRGYGRSGGSPYETRWMKRDDYRRKAGYEETPTYRKTSPVNNIKTEEYYKTNGWPVEEEKRPVSRPYNHVVPAATDYYRQSYEPVRETRREQSKYKNTSARKFKDVNFGLWTEAFYSKADLSGDNGFSGNATGFALGFDAEVLEDVILGVGYSNTSSDTDADQRTMTTTNDAFFLYGMYKPSNLYFSGIFTYGNSDTDETADFTGGVKANYSYGGTFYSAQGMVGYDADVFTPSLGMRYTSLTTDDYERTGQKVSGFTANTLTALAETRFATNIDYVEQNAVLRPEIKVGVSYDVVTSNEKANVTLPTNVSYEVEGTELNRFGVEAGVSASYNISNKFEISGAYEGEFRSGYTNHTLSIKARFNF